jgi:hypothetical protein
MVSNKIKKTLLIKIPGYSGFKANPFYICTHKLKEHGYK